MLSTNVNLAKHPIILGSELVLLVRFVAFARRGVMHSALLVRSVSNLARPANTAELS